MLQYCSPSMLSVKYGPFHPALENAFIAHLRGAGRPIAVVAPSRRLADRLERLAAVEHGMALLDVHFHTFFSLAAAIAEDAAAVDKTLILDPVFHDRIVDDILERDRGLRAVFAGKARPRALAGALRSSIRDLIDAGVRGDDLETYFGSELLRQPHEREMLSSLLRLSQAYESRLEELGVMSGSGLTRLAAQQAESSPFLEKFAEIIYYGFYDLTGQQLDFFENVVKHHQAVLFFPYRRDHPAFRFAETFFNEKLLAYNTQELDAGAQGTALGPVLDALFTAQCAAPAADKLVLMNASGCRDEVWAAAKEILSLVESGSAAYEDIGLIARSLEPYRAAIHEVFKENAVPFHGNAPAPLLRVPLAKHALNLLSLKRRDFPAVLVRDLIASPYFRPSSRLSRHWSGIIRDLGIHGGWLQWRGKLEKRAKDEEKTRTLWTWLSGLHQELGKEAKTWMDLADKSLAILDQHLVLPDRSSMEEAAAWGAVRDEIRSMSGFDRLGPASWDEFLDCLEDKLKRATLEAGEENRRGVRVFDAMGARGQSFKFLFLLGLKEKLFPRQVQEDPLLRDGARRALRHPGGYWIAAKASGYEEERLLFYMAVSSARERLYCVYPRSDESGKAEVPSIYLRELCRAAAIPTAESDPGRRVPRQPLEKLKGCPEDLLTPNEISLLWTSENRSPADYLTLLGRDGGLLESRWAGLVALNAWGRPADRDGLIGPPREHMAQLRLSGLSPKALDTFAQCPFRYFAERLLKLGEEDRVSEKGEFTDKARGLIYHAVLESFYRGVTDRFWKNTSDWPERLDQAVEGVFARYAWEEMGVYPLLWLSAKRSMAENLRRFVAEDLAEIAACGLRPAWFEKSLKADVPSLTGPPLRGVIDRVDLDAAGKRYRVIDYKTRTRPGLKLSAVIGRGEMHQLPLYAELVRQELGKEAEFESGRLYPIEDAEGGRPVYSAQEWSRDREAFFQGVSSKIKQMGEGRFPIKPDDGDFGYCRFCDYAGLCRKGHGPSRARALAGP